MSNLRDIHGEQYNPAHIGCPDLYCCKCECQTCKRAWFAAGRPHPKDCPEHGSRLGEQLKASGPRRLTRRMMQDAAEKVTWHGSRTDFVTDLLETLGLPEEFEVR